MAGRSLTRVQGGVTDTIHINTDRFAGVRTMTRTIGFLPLTDSTTSIQVTVAGHDNISGTYTGTTVAGATWTQQGGTGTIRASDFNATDGYSYLLEDADSDPQTLLNTGAGFTDRPWKAVIPSGITITGIVGTETVTVDRTASVIDSDPKGESRPLLSKVVGGAAAAYSLRDLNDRNGNNKVVRVRRASDNAERDFLAKEVSNATLKNWVNTQTVLPLDLQELTDDGRTGSVIPAKAAYSLRNLSSSYSGNVIEVRRSSDDTTQNFTADEITDGTLLAFVGTGGSDNGFVKTWYDQSGNTNHATQPTPASQPKIVDAGSLLANGIDFDGTDDELETSANISGSNISGFVVANLDGTGANSLYSVGDTKPNVLFGNPSLAYVVNGGSALSGGTAPTNTDTLFTQLFISGGTSKTFINGSAIASGDAGSNTASSDKLTIGNLEGINRFMDGSIEELIIYDSDQTDNRTAIEANIGEHYSISGIPAYDNTVDGFVETWYDQSGNGNDLTQATISKQPTIVTSGAINTRNNKPIIKFIQANENFLQTADSTMFPSGSSLAVTIFHAMHVDASSGNRIGLLGSNGMGNNASANSYRFGSFPPRKVGVKFADASGTQSQLISDQVTNNFNSIFTYQFALNGGTASLQAFNNGSSLNSVSVSTTDQSYSAQSGVTLLGSRTTGDNFSDSEYFEVIAYDSDQLANRPAIEANLSNQYDIALS